MPIGGSHGFAVDGERVLLGGSYTKKESLFLGTLDTLEFQELQPLDERGNPLKQFRPLGRRHSLYLATEDALYVVDLGSL